MIRPSKLARRTVNWSGVTSLTTALTAIGALIFTGLSLNATRDQVAVAQIDQRIAQQGQFTDRYSRAVEQLGQQGPDRLQIRLGGIYALERLARDSPRDQSTIIEVLNTFVRTNAPIRTPQAACPTIPPSDIQAAVTVLSRRDSNHDNGAVVDLSASCLVGADLKNAYLSGANFYRANLSAAHLDGAHLEDANLEDAELVATYLVDAHLVGANLNSAYLADVRGSRAYLVGAFLNGAYLDGAYLGGAYLADAELQGACLSGADLAGADLSGADLGGTDFRGAFLNGADLSSTDLSSTVHDEDTQVTSVDVDSNTTGYWW